MKNKIEQSTKVWDQKATHSKTANLASPDVFAEHLNLEKIESYIKSRKLELPACIALELYRPIVLLGDTLLLILGPALKTFGVSEALLRLFRDRQVVEELIKRLESDKAVV